MRCVIMQPTFLPWAGYFRLMALADQFVFLDDVQRVRQSWQTRNRVLNRGQIHWLIAPVEQGALAQTIAATQLVQGGPWRRKLGCLLRHGYGGHPFFSDLVELVELIENGREPRLAAYNIALIEFCAARLGIATPRQLSSTIAVDCEHRTQRLIEMCRRVGCDTYLSPSGAAEYLAADGFTDRCDMTLEFFDESPPPYAQRGATEFVSHLSLVDLIANLGWSGTRAYVNGSWLPKELTK